MESRPTRTCVISGGKRRLHTTYPDGFEMVEEFDINSHELLVRRVKKPVELGEAKWETEIGDEHPRVDLENELIAPSSANVILT